MANMTNTILPTQTERCFRYYENSIATIVDNWPSLTIITPQELSITTYVARLRDAIASLRKYHWTTEIHMERFAEIAELIVCAPRGDKIYAGPATAIRALSKPRQEQPIFRVEGEETEFVTNFFEAIRMVARLAHARLLTRPVVVVWSVAEQMTNLQNEYDIVVEQITTNKWRII